MCGDVFAEQFPEDVFADEASRDDLSLAAAGAFGDEAHARAGNLLGADLVGRVHTVAFGVDGVVERAHAFQLDGTSFVHKLTQHATQQVEHGEHVARAERRQGREPACHFLGGDWFSDGGSYRVPLAV